MLPGFGSWLGLFNELSTERALGSMLPGEIPGSAIRSLTEDWDPVESALFRKVIRAMDSVFLAHMAGRKSKYHEDEDPGSDNLARDAIRSSRKR